MAGRPSKFQEVFVEQAEKLAILGATDEEVALFFEVSRDTVYEWKKVHPEFSDALKKGKEIADMKVAESLFKRATGFEVTEQEDVMYKGKKETLKKVRQIPPETLAAIFWLKNRRPNEWRDKREVDNTHKLDESFIVEKTYEQSNSKP